LNFLCTEYKKNLVNQPFEILNKAKIAMDKEKRLQDKAEKQAKERQEKETNI